MEPTRNQIVIGLAATQLDARLDRNRITRTSTRGEDRRKGQGLVGGTQPRPLLTPGRREPGASPSCTRSSSWSYRWPSDEATRRRPVISPKRFEPAAAWKGFARGAPCPALRVGCFMLVALSSPPRRELALGRNLPHDRSWARLAASISIDARGADADCGGRRCGGRRFRPCASLLADGIRRRRDDHRQADGNRRHGDGSRSKSWAWGRKFVCAHR